MLDFGGISLLKCLTLSETSSWASFGYTWHLTFLASPFDCGKHFTQFARQSVKLISPFQETTTFRDNDPPWNLYNIQTISKCIRRCVVPRSAAIVQTRLSS